MSKDSESNLEAGRNGGFNPKEVVKDASDDNQAADKMGEMTNKLSNAGNISSSGQVTINEQQVDGILRDYLKPNAANEIGRELKANKRDGFAMTERDKGLPWRSFNEDEGKRPNKKEVMAIGIRAGVEPKQMLEEIRRKFPNTPNWLTEEKIRRLQGRLSERESESETVGEAKEGGIEATPLEIAQCVLQQGGWRTYWWGWQHDVPDRTCCLNFADFLINVGAASLIPTLKAIVAGAWIAGPVAILCLFLALYAVVLGFRIKYLLNQGSNGVILTGIWIPSVWAVRR